MIEIILTQNVAKAKKKKISNKNHRKAHKIKSQIDSNCSPETIYFFILPFFKRKKFNTNSKSHDWILFFPVRVQVAPWIHYLIHEVLFYTFDDNKLHIRLDCSFQFFQLKKTVHMCNRLNSLSVRTIYLNISIDQKRTN